MYIYTFIYIYVHIYMYIYIYTYIGHVEEKEDFLFHLSTYEGMFLYLLRKHTNQCAATHCNTRICMYMYII